MNRRHLACGLLLTATFLSACDDGTLDETQFVSYESLSDEYERIAARHGASATTFAADLPTTGGAVYEGVINIIVQDGPAVTDVAFSAVGGMELDVDFAAGQVQGGAQNFYVDDGTSTGRPVDGGGRFLIGPINRGAAAGDAILLTLSNNFFVDGSALSGTLAGAFRDQAAVGENPDGAFGTVGGTVTDGVGTTFRGTWVTQYDPTEELGEQ